MAGQNFNQANTAATDNGTKVFKAFYAPMDAQLPSIGGTEAPIQLYTFPTVTLFTGVPNLSATGSSEVFTYRVPAGDWLFLGAECVKTDASGDAGDQVSLVLAIAGDTNNTSSLATFNLSGSATGSSVAPSYGDFSTPVLGSRGDVLAFAVDTGTGSANSEAYVTVKLGMYPKIA